MINSDIIYPPRLQKGDKIAIISPATVVKKEYVEGAEAFLRKRGFEAVIMPHALGPSSGSFASSLESRSSDLHTALIDPSVKAILCARGGYGCIHLIPHTPVEMIRNNPKWMIGFSDVSALHALWLGAGVASIHGPMAKHLTVEPEDHPATKALLDMISGDASMNYDFPSHHLNRKGRGEGRIIGGNLAVLNGLASTPYDLFDAAMHGDVILFIEDISEAIYAVERMLTRISLSGALKSLRGLIIGQFTEYRADLNFKSMEEMISALLERHGIDNIPVAFDFPVGHVSLNYPIVEGAYAALEVGQERVTLKSQAK